MKRPLVNLLSFVFGDIGSRMLGFLITVYLARVLEPAGFGIMSLGFALLGFLQLAGNAGISTLEIRNVAAGVSDSTRVNSVLTLRVLLAVPLWAAVTAVAYACLTDDITRDVIVLFALGLFPLGLMLDWLFQGKEEFVITSVSRLIQYGVYGVFVVLAVDSVADLRWAGVAFSSGIAVQSVFLLGIYVRRSGAIRFQWSPALWKEMLAKGMPVGMAMLMAQSVVNLPPFIIAYFCSSTDVGLFSSAMRLILLMLLVDRALNALFLPVITRYSSSASGNVQMLVETTLRVVSGLVIAIGIAAAIAGKGAIIGVLGPEYEGALPSFYVLLGYFLLTVLNSVFVCVLIGSGREQRYAPMVTSGALVTCIATGLCTVQFGVLGAACGVVFGELVTVVLMAVEAKKVVQCSVLRILVRPMFAGVCMIVTSILTREMHEGVAIGLALAVFVSVEFALRGVTTGDIRFLREKFT